MTSHDGTYYLNILYGPDPMRPFELANEISAPVESGNGEVEASQGNMEEHRRLVTATFPGKSKAEMFQEELQLLGYAVGIRNAGEHNKIIAR